MKRAFLALLLVPLLSWGQTNISKKADELLSAYAKQEQFSGTVLIAKGGKVVFEKGYGYADREKQLPNSPETEFRIGSVTKPFTATLILQLQEKGKLSITDPVSKYLPEYPKGDSITIANLLNHTSGIPSITSMKQYYQVWMKEPATHELSISRFKNEPLRFSPGSKFEYSNSNYILLSYLAEKVSGKAFEELLTSELIGPLGLRQTGLDRTDRTSSRKAQGYQATSDDD